MPGKTKQIEIFDREQFVVANKKHPNSPEEMLEVQYITQRVREMRQLQKKTWREFNDKSLEQYIDDNEKRINSYVEPREDDLDDWQTKAFEGITREKMLAMISKVALDTVKYKFKAVRRDGFMDRTVSDIVRNFYEYSWQVEDPIGTTFFEDAWMIAGHGTGIRHEFVEQEEYEEEDFDDYDVRTGELKGVRKTVYRGPIECKARNVNLLDFMIPNWYETDVQKQPYVAEQQVMLYSQFMEQFGDYKHADKVPAKTRIDEDYGETFYMEQFDDMEDDKVLVVHFYSKENGRRIYRIIANGVLILATPIPRKDGLYPFGRGIFELMADKNFFYGMALPHKIMSDQDTYNALKNSVVDRAILHVNRPMITDTANEVLDDVMAPNKILQIKGNVQTLPFDAPNNNDIGLLEYMRTAANRQTTDAQQSGQTGKGVTAREIIIADENARKIMGAFRKFLERYDWECAKLRIGSIMQFYFDPTYSDEILDEGLSERAAAIYRTISLDGQTLSNGREGTKVIEVVGKREDVPPSRELAVQEEMARLQGMEMEKLVVNGRYIKNFKIDVAVIPQSSFEQSKSLEQAMETEYQRTVAAFYPQKFKQYEDIMFRELNRVYDKDMGMFDRTSQPQQPQPRVIEGRAQVVPQGQPAAVPAGGQVAAQLTQGGGAPSLSQLIGR